MDGEVPGVDSGRNSYYCSNKIPGSTHTVSEEKLQKMCDADARCTGYDYRGDMKFGRLCQQDKYIGTSTKTWKFKLCKKNVERKEQPTAGKNR